MDRLRLKNRNAERRSHRVRTVIRGTPGQPRLSVHVSNQHITAQIIDDSKGVTLAYASTIGKKAAASKTDLAAQIGMEIAAKAKKAKLTKVAFDRGSRQYHGRIKALADAARAEGLEF